MKKKPTNIPASILAKLKNIADRDNFDFNFLLVRYIQECFLSRLAVSGHVNKFVLKGGFLLLAYNIEKARPTRILTSSELMSHVTVRSWSDLCEKLRLLT